MAGWAGPGGKDFGGQPSAKIAFGEIDLSARSAWGNERPGAKLPALAFVAPAAGTHAVELEAEAAFFVGDGPARVLVLRHDKARARVRKLADVDVPAAGKPVRVTGLSVDLAAGDELLLVPAFHGDHKAANVTLRELAVTRR